MLDPDWTPVGSAFALSFSPWMHGEQSRSCLLSHIGRHYIGFRKITIQEPWTLGELPNIVISEEDAHGECLHLSTDAFFQFENAVSPQPIIQAKHRYINLTLSTDLDEGHVKNMPWHCSYRLPN